MFKKGWANVGSTNGHSADGYDAFLARKAQLGSQAGFDPVFMPDGLFDFQYDSTRHPMPVLDGTTMEQVIPLPECRYYAEAKAEAERMNRGERNEKEQLTWKF